MSMSRASVCQKSMLVNSMFVRSPSNIDWLKKQKSCLVGSRCFSIGQWYSVGVDMLHTFAMPGVEGRLFCADFPGVGPG